MSTCWSVKEELEVVEPAVVRRAIFIVTFFYSPMEPQFQPGSFSAIIGSLNVGMLNFHTSKGKICNLAHIKPIAKIPVFGLVIPNLDLNDLTLQDAYVFSSSLLTGLARGCVIAGRR
jgi:hypothetical protein